MRDRVRAGTSIPAEFAEAYSVEMTRISIGAAKIIALLGAVNVPLFSLTGIDYLFAPDRYQQFFVLRLIISAVCVALYFAARRVTTQRGAQLISAGVLVACAWGIALMIRVLGYESPYYAGMNLVYLAAIVVPWGALTTAGVCLIGYSAYLAPILVYDLDRLDLKTFVNNNEFQLFTIVVAATYNYFKNGINRREILSRLTIAEQARKLAELDSFKREFIANITHELKTPLSIMIGNTEVVMERVIEGENDPVRLQEHVRLIHQASFQLANHVDRIIAVSTVDEPDLKLDLDNYNYVGMVRNVFGALASKARDEQKTFTLQAPETALVVRLDEVRVEEILTNLIQNALKYTSAGGSVTVCVGADGENVYTEISDTGVGIAPDKVGRIFERMFQADDVLSKRHGGMGLGLYIARRNVEHHGGTISVQSALGRGTSFRFTLPLYADQTASVRNAPFTGSERRGGDRRTGVDRRAAERRRRFEYQQSMGIDDLANMSYTGNLADYENTRPGSPTVLVVEDNAGMMKVMVEALRDEYNLLLAPDGYHAIDKLEKHGDTIVLILSDIMMPGMSGYDFCAKVMEREQWRRIPLIFVTALMSEDDQLRGFRLGATDYIVKPYNIRILKEKVHHWIARRQYEVLMAGMSASMEERASQAGRIRDIILHEIRNPLQVIMGVNELLSSVVHRTAQLTDEHRETITRHVGMLREGVDALQAVVETTRGIDMAQIVKRVEVFGDIVRDGLVQTEHLRAGVALSVDADLAAMKVLCERRMVAQVLVNIIRNAVEAIREKGPAENGTIRIACRRDYADYATIEIADNGCGFDTEVRDKLFRFKYTTKKNGTGVGLHVSKIMLRLMGGDIWAESSKGAGATFFVSLPFAGGARAPGGPVAR